MDRAEIFGEAFVEPALRRRVVGIQQQVREIVGDGSPRLLFEQIQHDEILVFTRNQKAGHVDGLSLPQGRDLVVQLVVLEGEDGQRSGLVQAILGQQSRKH